eukprot:TRINITY_DN9982_c0_g1_i4.p1 TRINITY_DN9982_c0_g1~~TRINITY_DN9982_c0_g1_i4.p1  ORF type:complete len:393 (+),score=117.34 TRINITY_DN9982_c0_g1_i4:56-1180(+)
MPLPLAVSPRRFPNREFVTECEYCGSPLRGYSSPARTQGSPGRRRRRKDIAPASRDVMAARIYNELIQGCAFLTGGEVEPLAPRAAASGSVADRAAALDAAAADDGPAEAQEPDKATEQPSAAPPRSDRGSAATVEDALRQLTALDSRLRSCGLSGADAASDGAADPPSTLEKTGDGLLRTVAVQDFRCAADVASSFGSCPQSPPAPAPTPLASPSHRAHVTPAQQPGVITLNVPPAPPARGASIRHGAGRRGSGGGSAAGSRRVSPGVAARIVRYEGVVECVAEAEADRSSAAAPVETRSVGLITEQEWVSPSRRAQARWQAKLQKAAVRFRRKREAEERAAAAVSDESQPPPPAGATWVVDAAAGGARLLHV